MINIYAPINSLGYGVHANNMIKAFSDLNEETNLTTIGTIQNDPYFESYWKKSEKNKVNFSNSSPSLFIFHDEYSTKAKGSPLCTFSIFETDKIKEASLNALNNGPTDIVLATTDEHKLILEENGITKPISVIDEGVDSMIFNTIPIDKHIDTNKFTFITAGKNEERKNTSMAIRSFITTMKDKEVALIAHTFNPFINKTKEHPFKNLKSWSDINPISYGFEYKGTNNKFHKFSYKDCDIYFTFPGLQTAELGCLYHSANVGIQISRGEGWDLPAVEMLACGLPTIASCCIGHSHYLNCGPVIQGELLVEPSGKELANDGVWFNGTNGNWSIIDQTKVEEKLCYVFNNKERFENKSEEISGYMADNYSWESAAKKFIKLIK